MKDFKEYLMFKTQYNPELNETFISMDNCLSALEQAYNDGINDGKQNNNPSNEQELIDKFEAFRKAYNGTKRGLQTEYSNLKKKHKDYSIIIPKLLGIYEIQDIRRNAMKLRGDWIPQLPNLQTYINQRRWEEGENISDTIGDYNEKVYDEIMFGSKVYLMNGKKYYGNGIEIPIDSPRRPSSQYIFNSKTKSWYID